MKNFLLLTALVTGFIATAQPSFQLSLYPSTVAIAPNYTVYTTTSPSGNTKVTFDIKNTSASTHNYLAKRYDIQLNAVGNSTADAYFCFAGNCYVDLVTVSPNALTLTAGQSASQLSGTYNMLIADLDEATAVGPSKVKYTFFNQSQSSDSAQVSIFYNIPSGISEISSMISTIEMYPNPVNEHATLKFTSLISAESKLTVFNALGSAVTEKNISINEGRNKIDMNTETLSPGIYFANVKIGNSTFTKKFVVK